MSDTARSNQPTAPTEPSSPGFILDEKPAGTGRAARDLEQALRQFHWSGPDDERGAGGFTSPFRGGADASADVGASALGDACEALLGANSAAGIPIDAAATAPVRAFLRTARHQGAIRRATFQARIDELARQLGEILQVDRGKREARSPGSLQDSVGGASSFLDTAALSNVLGKWRGAAALSDERRARIETTIADLEQFRWEVEPLAVLVHDGSLIDALPPQSGEFLEVIRPRPCAAALDLYEERAAHFSRLFRAVRTAVLEVAGRFDPARHGPSLDRLDPDHFTAAERLLVPLVAVWDGVEGVATEEMPELMRVLLSDRPVNVLLHAHPIPARAGVPELGYLAVAHRKAFVAQSSVGSAQHLVHGLLRGLADMRPALHVILTGPDASRRRADRALSARVHPHFRYDPQAGSTWAGRMDFGGNPSEQDDWPEATVPFARPNAAPESWQLPITVADWALEQKELAAEFREVPDGCAEETLEPLGNYLTMDDHERAERIPFVWGVDEQNRLRRLVVTRRLVAICRERLDFWHTLQELAGIKSEYVLEAVRHTREEAEAQAAADRARRDEEHARELADTRASAVGDAMLQLSRRLLNLDFSAGAPPPAPAGPPLPAGSPTAPADPAVPGPDAVESNGDLRAASAEPWIDSPLCTSCNDCTNLNPLLFVYNENKQAKIGDPDAGTYAQLVKAAEACPSRCIHPGLPRNEQEKGLDRLIERAQPFQ